MVCLGVAASAGNAYGHLKHADFTIGVGSDLGSANFVPDANDWSSDAYVEDGKTYITFTYILPAPVTYYVNGHNGDPNYEIGAIESLRVDVDQDPAVSVNFVTRAGAAATTFSFPNWLDTTLYNAQAQASASITTTDRNGNGTIMTGKFPGAKVYEARYNSPATHFAYLVDSGNSNPNLSYSDNEDTGTAFTPLNTTVTRMEAEYWFAVSARDNASGTSNFQMIGTVPEPSGLLVLAAGLVPMLGIFRRRR